MEHRFFFKQSLNSIISLKAGLDCFIYFLVSCVMPESLLTTNLLNESLRFPIVILKIWPFMIYISVYIKRTTYRRQFNHIVLFHKTFWIVTEGYLEAENFLVHGGNSIYVILEVCSNRRPIYMGHIFHVWIYQIVYSAFSAVYFLAGGWSMEGTRYIYPFLDWTKPGQTFLFMPVLLIVPVVFQGLLIGLVRFRTVLWRRTGFGVSRSLEESCGENSLPWGSVKKKGAATVDYDANDSIERGPYAIYSLSDKVWGVFRKCSTTFSQQKFFFSLAFDIPVSSFELTRSLWCILFIKTNVLSACPPCPSIGDVLQTRTRYSTFLRFSVWSIEWRFTLSKSAFKRNQLRTSIK